MARFASHLPVTVVAELVGLNAAGRANMLRWAAATFNILCRLALNCKNAPVLIELGT